MRFIISDRCAVCKFFYLFVDLTDGYLILHNIKLVFFVRQVYFLVSQFLLGSCEFATLTRNRLIGVVDQRSSFGQLHVSCINRCICGSNLIVALRELVAVVIVVVVRTLDRRLINLLATNQSPVNASLTSKFLLCASICTVTASRSAWRLRPPQETNKNFFCGQRELRELG